MGNFKTVNLRAKNNCEHFVLGVEHICINIHAGLSKDVASFFPCICEISEDTCTVFKMLFLLF